MIRAFTQQPLNPDFGRIRLKFSYLGLFGITFLNSGLQVHNKTPTCIFLYYVPIFKSVTRMRLGSFRMKWGLLDKSPSFQTLSASTPEPISIFMKNAILKNCLFIVMCWCTLQTPILRLGPQPKLKINITTFRI